MWEMTNFRLHSKYWCASILLTDVFVYHMTISAPLLPMELTLLTHRVCASVVYLRKPTSNIPVFSNFAPPPEKLKIAQIPKLTEPHKLHWRGTEMQIFLFFHIYAILQSSLSFSSSFVSTKQNNHLIFDNLFLWKTFIIQITNDNLQLTYFYHNYCYYKH